MKNLLYKLYLPIHQWLEKACFDFLDWKEEKSCP